MSNKWESVSTRNANTTVGELMKTAHSDGDYKLLTNNCQHIAQRVYQKGQPSFYNDRDVAKSVVDHYSKWQTLNYDPHDYFKDAPTSGNLIKRV